MLIIGGLIGFALLILFIAGAGAAILTWLALKAFVIICALIGGFVGAAVIADRGGFFIGMICGCIVGLVGLASIFSATKPAKPPRNGR
jgi:hypothetical protein